MAGLDRGRVALDRVRGSDWGLFQPTTSRRRRFVRVSSRPRRLASRRGPTRRRRNERAGRAESPRERLRSSEIEARRSKVRLRVSDEINASRRVVCPLRGDTVRKGHSGVDRKHSRACHGRANELASLERRWRKRRERESRKLCFSDATSPPPPLRRRPSLLFSEYRSRARARARLEIFASDEVEGGIVHVRRIIFSSLR